MLKACCLSLTKTPLYKKERSEETGRTRKLVSGYTFAVTKADARCYAADRLRLRCPVRPNLDEHMSATDMHLNLQGALPPRVTAVPAIGETDWSQAMECMDQRYADAGPRIGWPLPRTCTRYELAVAEPDLLEKLKKKHRLNIVDSFGSLHVCETQYIRANSGMGRYYTGISTPYGAMQTTDRHTRMRTTWQAYYGELDQVKGNQTIAASVFAHHSPGTPITHMRSYLTDGDEHKRRVGRAFGIGDGPDAVDSTKRLFHAIHNTGTVEGWVQREAEETLMRLLHVKGGRAQSIYHYLHRHASDHARLQQESKRYLKGLSGADGLSADSVADAVRAAFQASADLSRHWQCMADDHPDAHRLIKNYERDCEAIRDKLLAQYPQFVEACKNSDGSWKSRDHSKSRSIDRRKKKSNFLSAKSAYHLLLCHFEVPILIWTSDFLLAKGHMHDALIHDGGQIRRREFAATEEQARADVMDESIIRQCESHIAEMSQQHLGVRIEMKLKLKPALD
jgi:hypothetical protein